MQIATWTRSFFTSDADSSFLCSLVCVSSVICCTDLRRHVQLRQFNGHHPRLRQLRHLEAAATKAYLHLTCSVRALGRALQPLQLHQRVRSLLANRCGRKSGGRAPRNEAVLLHPNLRLS